MNSEMKSLEKPAHRALVNSRGCSDAILSGRPDGVLMVKGSEELDMQEARACVAPLELRLLQDGPFKGLSSQLDHRIRCASPKIWR